MTDFMEVPGDIFTSHAQAIVVAVNCVGVMGAGQALQCKQLYPDVFAKYKAACDNYKLSPGKVLTLDSPNAPYKIIMLPTKVHWRDRSKIEWISAGLYALKHEISKQKLTSIALSKLGCGLGGLDWRDVQRLVWDILSGDDFLEVLVYV